MYVGYDCTSCIASIRNAIDSRGARRGPAAAALAWPSVVRPSARLRFSTRTQLSAGLIERRRAGAAAAPAARATRVPRSACNGALMED